MKITTRQMVEIEVAEKDIIVFENGVVGFEEFKKYALLMDESEEPFCRMQSIEKPETAFVLVNPLLFTVNYDFEVEDDVIESIGLEDPDDVQLYAIVTVNSDYKKMTANLLAPILVNTKNQKARQLILSDSKYTTKHYIFSGQAVESALTEDK